MFRPVHLVFLLLAVVLVASLEGPPEPQGEVAPSYVYDLDADASHWGYSRPWRYGGGWKGGWYGGRGGWSGRGWGYKGWNGGWW